MLGVISGLFAAGALPANVSNLQNVFFHLGVFARYEGEATMAFTNTLPPGLVLLAGGVFAAWHERRAGAGANTPVGLDETVHQRHRLGILTITAEAGKAGLGGGSGRVARARVGDRGLGEPKAGRTTVGRIGRYTQATQRNQAPAAERMTGRGGSGGIGNEPWLGGHSVTAGTSRS